MILQELVREFFRPLQPMERTQYPSRILYTGVLPTLQSISVIYDRRSNSRAIYDGAYKMIASRDENSRSFIWHGKDAYDELYNALLTEQDTGTAGAGTIDNLWGEL